MSDSEVIYHIKQTKRLDDIWSEFSLDEKKLLVSIMNDRKEKDLERTMLEIRTGQNRLF